MIDVGETSSGRERLCTDESILCDCFCSEGPAVGCAMGREILMNAQLLILGDEELWLTTY